jgi:hypothetical protein
MVACGTLMEERNSTSAGSHSGSRAMTEGGCEADSDVLVLREMLSADDVVDGAESRPHSRSRASLVCVLHTHSK